MTCFHVIELNSFELIMFDWIQWQVILYFYRCHNNVKNFAFKHFHRRTDQISSDWKPPLRPPPVSHFSQYHPQLQTQDNKEKPPVPVRMHFISEPIAVSINGVSVSRQQSHQSQAWVTLSSRDVILLIHHIQHKIPNFSSLLLIGRNVFL